MFFIPIAAIVIFIWLIVHAVQEGRMASLQADINRSIEKTEKLRNVAVDWELSYAVEQQLRKPQLQRQVVADFMGGGPEWELYSCNLDKGSLLTLSMNAVLAKQGHLTSSLSNGVGDMFFGCGTQMKLVEWRAMTEQYLLALADELEKHGVHTEVICYNSSPANRIPRTTLRKYIAEHGPGQTEGFSYTFTGAS